MHTNLIICDDFNINLHTHNTNSKSSYLVNIIYSIVLVPVRF